MATTIAKVRASLNPDVVRNDCLALRIVRPIANAITPPFIELGVSANAITVIRILISAAALAVLAFSGAGEWYFVLPAFYLAFVLDCVDGNVARLSASVTYWGKFLDGLGDNVYAAFAPAAAAIGVWSKSGSNLALFVGLAATAGALLNQCVRYRLSFFREWMTAETGALTESESGTRRPYQRFEDQLARSWVNLTFLAILILPVGLSEYMWALAAVHIPIDAAWIVSSICQARRLLDRNRRSKYELR